MFLTCGYGLVKVKDQRVKCDKNQPELARLRSAKLNVCIFALAAGVRWLTSNSLR